MGFCRNHCETIPNHFCTTAILDLKSWSKKIVDLQSELKDLKTEVSSLKSLLDEKITERSVNAVDNSSINQNSDCNMIINEVLERQKREANVIMFNVTESQKISHTERVSEDTILVKKHLELIVPDINTNNIKMFRLGKLNTTTCRPIKIIFNPPKRHILFYVIKEILIME